MNLTTKNRKVSPEAATTMMRQMPQAPEMEAAVLAAILGNADCFDTVADILKTEECFFNDAHKRIYQAMLSLGKRGVPVDLLTVTDELRRTEFLDMVGGAFFLTNLSMSVLSDAHVEAHCRYIKEMHIARQLVHLGAKTIDMGHDKSADAFEVLEFVEKELFQISSGIMKKDFVTADRVVKKVMDQDQEMMELPEGLVGFPTGNSDLDQITGGFKPGKLIIVAARPSVGKTAFTLNIAFNGAINSNKAVGFFSLEMENDELMRRLVSIDTQIDTYKVDYPKQRTPEEQERIQASYQKLAKCKIVFDDTPGINMQELRAKARRMKSKHDIQALFLDYLQLMQGDGERSSFREAEISKISRELKALAKELKIPVIALAQLNREIEKSDTKKFKLSHLRESGGIEQDADLILFLWRPSADDIKQDPSLKNTGKVEIAKHRGGKKKKIMYHADMSTQTWANYDPFRVNPPQPKQKALFQTPASAEDRAFSSHTPSPQTIDDIPF